MNIVEKNKERNKNGKQKWKTKTQGKENMQLPGWLSWGEYVAVSASVIIWVPKSDESKSGQMVPEKVIWS